MARRRPRRQLLRRQSNNLPRLAASARVTLRVVLAVVGGYGFTAGCVALLAVALTLAGTSRSEAAVLAAMLGFLLYLVVLLWSFATRRFASLATVLILGGVATHALACKLA